MGALLPVTTVTDAVANLTGPTVTLRDVKYIALQGRMTYGSGGTNAKMWVQTSIDEGASWIDIAEFTFTTANATRVYALMATSVASIYTPTDATITANTSKDGILGDRFRVKYTTTGIYGGSTTIRVDAVTIRG